MAAQSSTTTAVEQVMSEQPPNLGRMVSHWLLRSVRAVSAVALFSMISGTALAKAIAPAARTAKMVEKRMMKRIEKATLAESDWVVSMRDLSRAPSSFYRQSKQ